MEGINKFLLKVNAKLSLRYYHQVADHPLFSELYKSEKYAPRGMTKRRFLSIYLWRGILETNEILTTEYQNGVVCSEYDEPGTTMGVYSGGYQKRRTYADFDVFGAGRNLGGVKLM